VLDGYRFEERIGNSVVIRQPAGVGVCLTPWNVPLLPIVQKVVPALAAGCTVVRKSSELTPLNAYLLSEVMADADLPPGVFNVVVGRGPVAGAALVRHPVVDLVSLTGSTRAGREVSALAAGQIKRVQLELGDKNASLVLPDADLAAALLATVDQVCFNTGQTCLREPAVGTARSRRGDAGGSRRRHGRLQRRGPARSGDGSGTAGVGGHEGAGRRVHPPRCGGRARLVFGGPGRPTGLDTGYYARPTLFGDVTSRMSIAQEEIFGPVLSVIGYGSMDEAARIANDTPYGLHGAVWGADDTGAAAARIRTGVVDVNGGPFNPLALFGGFKRTGVGRECGVAGLEGFLETKPMQYSDASAGLLGPRLRDTVPGVAG
jgi:aldehyde dehydrogenase (NAD+)